MLEGLPPNSATHVMRLSCDEATARAVADIIVETFDPATTAAAAFEEAPDTSSWNKGPWAVEVYFGAPPDEANSSRPRCRCRGRQPPPARRLLVRCASATGLPHPLRGLVRCGQGGSSFMARMTAGTATANDIAIEIEAALAFGTGPSWFDARLSSACWRALRGGGGRPPSSILAPARAFLAIAAAKLFKRAIAPAILILFA